MARAPVPGRVKTRLCPPLDAEQAAEFYECVLRDVLGELAASERWDTWVAYAERSRYYFQQLTEPGIALLPQRGASLGERMHAVFTDLCHAGYSHVVHRRQRHSHPEGCFDHKTRAIFWNGAGAIWSSARRTTAATT